MSVDADAGATGHGPYAAAGRHLPEGCCLADNGDQQKDTGALIIGDRRNDDLTVHKEQKSAGYPASPGIRSCQTGGSSEMENIGRHICLDGWSRYRMQFSHHGPDFMPVLPFRFMSCFPIIVNAGACRKRAGRRFWKIGVNTGKHCTKCDINHLRSNT